MIRPTKKGPCEICEADTKLFQLGNMYLCQAHYESELHAIEQLREVTQHTVQQSRQIDSTIQLSRDVCNAATIPIVNLMAAVNQDDTIPADQKDFTLYQLVSERIDKLTSAIFEEKSALVAHENERYAWIKNAQEIVGRLKAEQKARVKQFDISYSTKSPKTIKPTKVPSNKAATFKKSEYIEAAAKYKLPMDKIRLVAIQHNLSPDAAGLKLQRMLND